MRVMVDLDPRDVWRIQEKAEKANRKPGDVLRDELTQRRNAATVRERVRVLVTVSEMCDADIAAELHYPPGTIAGIRRSLGLKAVPRYPRRSA